MNKYFNLKHTGGPYQDATSSYSVEVAKDANINDVVTQILNENEYGTIVIWVHDPKLKDCPYLADNEKFTQIKISYNNRNVEFKKGYDLYNTINKIVPQTNKHYAKGGYGNMDFTFFLD